MQKWKGFIKKPERMFLLPSLGYHETLFYKFYIDLCHPGAANGLPFLDV